MSRSDRNITADKQINRWILSAKFGFSDSNTDISVVPCEKPT